MASSSLGVYQLLSLLKQSPAKAQEALGVAHVLVPLEPWESREAGAREQTSTGRSAIRVKTGAGKQVPSLATDCYPLSIRGPLTVGRMPGAGLTIDQPTVSRVHAEISCVGGVFSVLDKGSYNGTILNNQVLEQGEAVPLKNGDVVVFGEAQLVFGDLAHLATLI